MVELGQELRLALEAREALRVRGEGRGQDLDRDLALELRVGGAVDLAHAALAELGGDLVGAEAGSRAEAHRALPPRFSPENQSSTSSMRLMAGSGLTGWMRRKRAPSLAMLKLVFPLIVRKNRPSWTTRGRLAENVAPGVTVTPIKTDKVTLEVPAPAAGVLSDVAAKNGDTVAVGALLGQIKEGAGAAPKRHRR